MNEKEFWEKYYFNPLKTVVVVNPDKEDFTFSCTIDTGIDIMSGKPQSTSRDFKVEAGASRPFPGPVANMYLDQMYKKLVQQDDKVAMMPDFATRQEYYDKLIVKVTDNMDTVFDLPQYANAGEEKKETKAEEKPFGGLDDKTSGAKPRSTATSAVQKA